MQSEAKKEKESDERTDGRTDGRRTRRSTCLTLTGDISYTNNEAKDDKILCMTSATAVLARHTGTLNHPHRDAPTQLDTHAHRRFHFAFSSPMSDKAGDYKAGEGGGATGSLSMTAAWLFINQYPAAGRTGVNAGVVSAQTDLVLTPSSFQAFCFDVTLNCDWRILPVRSFESLERFAADDYWLPASRGQKEYRPVPGLRPPS